MGVRRQDVVEREDGKGGGMNPFIRRHQRELERVATSLHHAGEQALPLYSPGTEAHSRYLRMLNIDAPEAAKEYPITGAAVQRDTDVWISLTATCPPSPLLREVVTVKPS